MRSYLHYFAAKQQIGIKLHNQAIVVGF